MTDSNILQVISMFIYETHVSDGYYRNNRQKILVE